MMTYKIFENVKLGKDCRIDDYVLVGYVGHNSCQGLQTIIGDNATIRSHTVIYAGNQIGDGFHIGHQAMVREKNQIGNNVSIGTRSIIEHHVQIADDVRIHSGVFVPEYSILEQGCWLGPNVTITNAKYPRSPKVKENLNGATICRKAKIGANVTLLPGVVIGENALVGAGSVVVKDVPANSVYAGNPAVEINKIANLPY